MAWNELARPQVHGYDMSCIAALDDFRFVSGAEEKVIRGFTATGNFIRNLCDICNVNIEDIDSKFFVIKNFFLFTLFMI